MKVALVTLTIGEGYIEQHARIFMPSQRAYAERHGYDYRVITDYSGPIRHPALICLEKQLICSQPWAAEYDCIIYIDADMLIHPLAPALHTKVSPTDSILMVDEMSQPTRADRHALQVRSGWEQSVPEYYARAGLDFNTDIIYNGGLIVWNTPARWSGLCRSIYMKYAKAQLTHPRGYHYEQAVVNFEYQTNGLCRALDPEWNAIWALHKETTFQGNLAEFIEKNHFVHLAGHYDYEAALSWTAAAF
jgi:hypothetical protein